MQKEVAIQREYYERTSVNYDAMHMHDGDGHYIAMAAFAGLAELFPHESFLDVGAGTGRGVSFLMRRFPNSRIVGIEPSRSQREQAYAKSIPESVLTEGDALNLPFADGEFDWVMETGTLHHIKDFRRAAAEMCRVARQGVLISDANNMGQGSSAVRLLKRTIKSLGLWNLAIYLQTGGKGYKQSDGDGIYYSFCAFDCVDILRKKFEVIHYMNTEPASPCLDRGAGHVMLLARKG